MRKGTVQFKAQLHNETVLVQGYPILLPGYDCVFVIHKEVEPPLYRLRSNYWDISELSTGYSLLTYCETQPDIRTALKYCLRKITKPQNRRLLLARLETLPKINAVNFEPGMTDEDFTILSCEDTG